MPDFSQKNAVCDANVLIDFAQCDSELLCLIPGLFSRVYVPYMVLFELNELSISDLESAGFELMETEVMRSPVNGLSAEDWACILAVDKCDGICLTNDKKLRNELIDKGHKVLWTLETILLMVEKKIISQGKAEAFGEKIVLKNPYISKRVYQRFSQKLNK